MSGALPQDSSALCVDCGLCCNGDLYSSVKAKPAEIAPVPAGGLGEAEGPGPAGEDVPVPLPCAHHQQGRCGIYATRFAKCRAFRCLLLKRLEAGDIALPEALELVAKAKAMVAGLAATDPALAQSASRAALLREPAAAPGELDRATADLRFEIVVLDRTFATVRRSR